MNETNLRLIFKNFPVTGGDSHPQLIDSNNRANCFIN